MNLPAICNAVDIRLEKIRASLKDMTIADAARAAECITPKPAITRRALTAIFATYYHCQQFENNEPTHDELLDLWKILKEEIIFEK